MWRLTKQNKKDWRVGLFRQAMQYATDRDMEVRGKVPGVFWFLGSSIAQYPIYSLNYVRTFLRLDIPLEDIEFSPVPDDVQKRWGRVIAFLQTKSPTDQLRSLDSAVSDYTGSYNQLLNQWIKEKSIDMDEYEASCEREFSRVFEERFS